MRWARARWAQRRGAVKVQGAGQAALPNLAVLLPDLFSEPGGGDSEAVSISGRWLFNCCSCPFNAAKRHEKLKQAPKVVFSQQSFGVGSDQKIHVSAGRLLLSGSFQLAQKSAGVGRIDDGQLVNQLRLAGRQIPSHRAAPVMGNQTGNRCAATFHFDQGCNVADQMLGPVSRHVCGRA